MINDHPDGDTVEVQICNSGNHRAAPPTESGFGLVGLAERVRALGGDLAAGPHPDGGFAVRARMPLHVRSRRMPDDTLPLRRSGS